MFSQETVIHCNKASNGMVSKTKGFSVFFWITLSHEVSRPFPTHTSTYANFENLLYIRCTLADIPLHWWRIRCPMEGEEQNPGSSVADCIHTAIFQNICGIRVPYHANREPNPGRCSTCIRSQIYICNKRIR